MRGSIQDLGTIEVRAPDAQSDLRRVGALAALVHCLARVEAERDQREIPVREALAESAFQATRHGLGARLLDRRPNPCPRPSSPCKPSSWPGRPPASSAVKRSSAYLETMLEEGSGADLQRAVHAEGGMEALLNWLCEGTANCDLAPAQPSP